MISLCCTPPREEEEGNSANGADRHKGRSIEEMCLMELLESDGGAQQNDDREDPAVDASEAVVRKGM